MERQLPDRSHRQRLQRRLTQPPLQLLQLMHRKPLMIDWLCSRQLRKEAAYDFATRDLISPDKIGLA